MAKIKTHFLGKLAKYISHTVEKKAHQAVADQRKTLKHLVQSAKNTQFGLDHKFATIKSYEDFKQKVPVRGYEQIKPYIEEIKEGKKNVLWKKLPLYWSKTSGTTSGAKYIPITKASMPSHIKAARNALFNYVHQSKNAQVFNGKMIFVQGSPVLERENGIQTGRLSGIVAHYVPNYLTKNRLPSWDINCIEHWETKIEEIVKESVDHDMTVIGGIPPWLVMYFEYIVNHTGKKVGEVFPNLKMIMMGGVNFEPYRKTFLDLIGREIDYVELYPASEGFIAYQDNYTEKGLLLNTDGGIFYEFIPVNEFYNENPTRLSIEQVEMGVDYAIILTTNAGLWAYAIGDTVQFTSLSPYRVIVSGRVAHFTSAFGEHVIAKEVEQAIQVALEHQPETRIREFTLAPQVNPPEGELPYHEWFIEFVTPPKDEARFQQDLETEMLNQNSYYKDLIDGKMLQPLIVRKVETNAFVSYMKSIGKLGEQNKPPRLSNDRKMATELEKYVV